MNHASAMVVEKKRTEEKEQLPPRSPRDWKSLRMISLNGKKERKMRRMGEGGRRKRKRAGLTDPGSAHKPRLRSQKGNRFQKKREATRVTGKQRGGR